jgi:hypothetical protein
MKIINLLKSEDDNLIMMGAQLLGYDDSIDSLNKINKQLIGHNIQLLLMYGEKTITLWVRHTQMLIVYNNNGVPAYASPVDNH